jgi:hypothetical protein
LLKPGFAGLEAFLAGVGALLAVVVGMFAAFIVADLADLYAFFHDVAGMGGITGHQPACQGAHIGAVPVVLNAFDHHLHLLFLQAQGSAALTSRNALNQYMFQIISYFRFHNWHIYGKLIGSLLTKGHQWSSNFIFHGAEAR